MDLSPLRIQQQEIFIVIAPLLKKIAAAAEGETMTEDSEGRENLEDSPFERTLCATWDLSTVADYAVVMYQSRLSRMLLKIVTVTARVRTRELAMGILANLSCHYDELADSMVHDIDLCKVCRSILWHENDARVLLETTRLLFNFYSYGDLSRRPLLEEQGMETTNGLFFLLMPTDDILPSMIHQITAITLNTLHTQLLLACLQLLISITRFLCTDHDHNVVDGPIEHTVLSSAIAQIKQYQVAKLVLWGLDRLEEQSRGVGIGMGLNRSIAIHVMQLLWLFFHHDMVTLNNDQGTFDYISNDILTHRLKPSMETIVAYIQQEEDFDKSSDDTEIEQLAEALSHFAIQ